MGAIRPGGGGGASSVASTDITDSTATGRSVLTAANAAAARTAIGAIDAVAVGDLASDAPVALASAAAAGNGTTAARSNHVHPTTGLAVLAATAQQVLTTTDAATGVTRSVAVSHESSGVLGTGFGVGVALQEGAEGGAVVRATLDAVRESGGGSQLSIGLKDAGSPTPAERLTLSSAGRLATAETMKPYTGTVANITGGVWIVAPTAGCMAFATNGRKPGEGAGLGTGVPCFYDGTGWFSCCDGAALAA